MTAPRTTNVIRKAKYISETPVRFRFDGVEYVGQQGDTAASALLANGVRLLGRSVKYRRRRGMLANGSDEPNALLTLGDGPDCIPNIPATRLTIQPGMLLFSQNRWPSLNHDASAILRLGKGIFGAGFYYKTFIWPSWKIYEGVIRRLAGLGKAPRSSSLPTANRDHRVCDVVVAGGGPAGLVAALESARRGNSVVLCEASGALGGELCFEDATLDGLASDEWVAQMEQKLTEAGVEIQLETTVVSARQGIAVAHREPGGVPGTNDGLLYIYAKSVLMATGACEYPIAFIDNDLPGTMLLGAAERLVAGFGAIPGEKAVLFGNHDRIYSAARRLLHAGIEIAAIADTRTETHCPERQILISSGIACHLHTAVKQALGPQEVTGAKLAKLGDGCRTFDVNCDLILTSGGWTPWSMTSDNVQHQDHVLLCGAANGLLALPAAVEDALAKASARPEISNFVIQNCDPEPKVVPIWASPASLKEEKTQFVDFQNDVTVADLRQSVAEGFGNIEHTKRYTTLAFGTDQGRTAKAIGSALTGRFVGSEVSVPHSKPRRPYRSVSISALAGWRREQFLRPVRRTPLTEQHLGRNAVMQPTGLWLRPHFFPENGSTPQEAGFAEARRTRKTGGITDISTLGKVEISGPDAAGFVDRLCLSRGSTMRPRRGKYAVLLREDGFVLDDGILVRMQEDRFLLMTSTSHAGMVHSHLEYWHAMEWNGRNVAVTDISDSWGGVVVAGRSSQDAVKKLLGERWSASIEQLKHMDYMEAEFVGKTIRILRASFSGEHAYEIYSRPAETSVVWKQLLDQGYEPYGLEALDIMRVEKGYLTGAEINGQTTPADLGFGQLVARNRDCIGANMLARPALSEESRKTLFGIRATEPNAKLYPGAQVTQTSDLVPIGHVTSAARSPMLETSIGLALIDAAIAESQARFIARDPLHGVQTPIVLTPVCQFDPEKSRFK